MYEVTTPGTGSPRQIKSLPPLELRQTLARQGYEPVVARGKIPACPGWQHGDTTSDRVSTETTEHPAALNTGIRTGKVVAIDIDVDDPSEVAEIEATVREALGASSFRRVGKKGCLLLYSNDDPIDKITIAAKDKTKVEILGAGQQFIAYGIHPETGQPYHWTEDGYEPAEYAPWQLPAVTQEQLREAVRCIASVLGKKHNGVRVTGAGLGQREPTAAIPLDTGFPALPPGEIRGRLYRCNPDCSRDDWRNIAAALIATPCTDEAFDKLALFIEWSAMSKTHYDDAEGEARAIFETMPAKEGGIGPRSFIYFTKQAGYDGPSAIYDLRTAEEALKPYLAAATTAGSGAPAQKSDFDLLVDAFRGREPDEDEALPDLEFWDDRKTLPRTPGGCIGIIYGPTGTYKSAVALSMVVDLIREKGARVLYCAGEGQYGLGKQRLPAVCRDRGIETRDLRGRYRKADRVPRLDRTEDMKAVIAAYSDLAPEIIVIDTLGTGVAGLDENSATTASLLTGNGPIAELKRAFGATIIIVAHTGKDESRGIRGSAAFAQNVDFVWKFKKVTAQVTETYVEKMKDGEAGFALRYRISAGVPVATLMSASEVTQMAEAESTPYRKEVQAALLKLGEVPVHQLAHTLVTQKLSGPVDPEDMKREETNEVKRLQRLARPDPKTGKRGILADFLAVDVRGEPLNPQRWKPLPVDDDGDDGFIGLRGDE